MLMILAAFLATTTHACPAFAAEGLLPQAPAAVVICFDGYALGHSAADREPLWSAEHLTAAGVATALKAKRAGDFHPELLLPKSDRAELSDYLCADQFDRGHMTPVGDFGVTSEENDTFTLANMVPQLDTLNEGLWAGLEGAVRQLAQHEGELYIVTGPVFGSSPAKLKGRVTVPIATFKAVWDPATHFASAYVAQNDASGAYKVVSISTLQEEIGFDPFPGLAPAIKAHVSDLPKPLKLDSALKPRACTK